MDFDFSSSSSSSSEEEEEEDVSPRRNSLQPSHQGDSSYRRSSFQASPRRMSQNALQFRRQSSIAPMSLDDEGKGFLKIFISDATGLVPPPDCAELETYCTIVCGDFEGMTQVAQGITPQYHVSLQFPWPEDEFKLKFIIYQTDTMHVVGYADFELARLKEVNPFPGPLPLLPEGNLNLRLEHMDAPAAKLEETVYRLELDCVRGVKSQKKNSVISVTIFVNGGEKGSTDPVPVKDDGNAYLSETVTLELKNERIIGFELWENENTDDESLLGSCALNINDLDSKEEKIFDGDLMIMMPDPSGKLWPTGNLRIRFFREDPKKKTVPLLAVVESPDVTCRVDLASCREAVVAAEAASARSPVEAVLMDRDNAVKELSNLEDAMATLDKIKAGEVIDAATSVDEVVWAANNHSQICLTAALSCLQAGCTHQASRTQRFAQAATGFAAITDDCVNVSIIEADAMGRQAGADHGTPLAAHSTRATSSYWALVERTEKADIECQKSAEAARRHALGAKSLAFESRQATSWRSVTGLELRIAGLATDAKELASETLVVARGARRGVKRKEMKEFKTIAKRSSKTGDASRSSDGEPPPSPTTLDYLSRRRWSASCFGYQTTDNTLDRELAYLRRPNAHANDGSTTSNGITKRRAALRTDNAHDHQPYASFTRTGHPTVRAAARKRGEGVAFFYVGEWPEEPPALRLPPRDDSPRRACSGPPKQRDRPSPPKQRPKGGPKTGKAKYDVAGGSQPGLLTLPIGRDKTKKAFSRELTVSSVPSDGGFRNPEANARPAVGKTVGGERFSHLTDAETWDMQINLDLALRPQKLADTPPRRRRNDDSDRSSVSSKSKSRRKKKSIDSKKRSTARSCWLCPVTVDHKNEIISSRHTR